MARKLRAPKIENRTDHVQIGGNTFNWYVFNLADVAIVAGVMALLYDSFMWVPAAKVP
jgi:signal peptidase II